MPRAGVSSSESSRRGAGAFRTLSEDRRITVFCSDGRLYQVDYAWNATKLAGVTSVGVRGTDSVCVVGQRRANTHAPKDKLLDMTSVSRLFPITDRLGLLATGIAGDLTSACFSCHFCQNALQNNLLFKFEPTRITITSTAAWSTKDGEGRALAHEARNQTAEFRFNWGYEMPPDVLAQWIADRAQIWTQYVSKRPSGVVAMILGIDDEKGTPQLFTCDPAGYFFGHKHRDQIPDLVVRSNFDLFFSSRFQMAISALQFALKADLKASEVEVGVVRTDDPTFRVLTEAEIDEHLEAINPEPRHSEMLPGLFRDKLTLEN
ncbi:Proteasome subunit alpha type 6 [Zea mays]|uniref:Proteasome subunit alpha type 6 n=1 Tax=Zea mays TaxID=4577 RepID=A0A1D6IJH2_MAIZE|nr:Proteasome subunit alpha type 6 [Zea mays]